ncbi:histidine phosphatase family protein [Rhizobium sp. S152]|uniref:histidine phosphatase family protein n=1 Tax=Rhizobium sp. S152 TaxID=3055038 RepID=UPI0025A9FB6D|nr:histidine phosphatase family protein [Rhizobium sp. S152]MDM9626110.1 histidine phosphatase family protein [Rhizobium sp. S152]
MMTRLTWICSGATEANRQARFPLDESLEEKATVEARTLAPGLRRADRVFASPALRARQTAEALGLDPVVTPELSDCDYGRWAGRSIAEIEANELAAWMSDPQATPHGGESIATLCARVEAWMDGQLTLGGHVLAISHAPVLRAAILVTLRAPSASFWRVDAEPLSTLQMTSNGTRWSLRI